MPLVKRGYGNYAFERPRSAHSGLTRMPPTPSQYPRGKKELIVDAPTPKKSKLQQKADDSDELVAPFKPFKPKFYGRR